MLHVKSNIIRSFCGGAAEMNLPRNDEVAGSIPCLAQWVKDLSALGQGEFARSHPHILHPGPCEQHHEFFR